jgi:hypothetical protein
MGTYRVLEKMIFRDCTNLVLDYHDPEKELNKLKKDYVTRSIKQYGLYLTYRFSSPGMFQGSYPYQQFEVLLNKKVVGHETQLKCMYLNRDRWGRGRPDCIDLYLDVGLVQKFILWQHEGLFSFLYDLCPFRGVGGAAPRHSGWKRKNRSGKPELKFYQHSRFEI